MTKKITIGLSFLLIFLGFLLLWFGLNLPEQTGQTKSIPIPTSIAQISEQKESPESEIYGIEGERAYVTKVVDGDTIVVVIDGVKHTVRLLGVDTPETVDPRKSVQCFGKEASNEVKSLLTGKEVILQKDVSDTDFYKRWLRFIYLPLEDGNYLFVNDYLIREGFAKVLTIPPDVKFGDQFLDAQKQARENKKGLWGRC